MPNLNRNRDNIFGVIGLTEEEQNVTHARPSSYKVSRNPLLKKPVVSFVETPANKHKLSRNPFLKANASKHFLLAPDVQRFDEQPSGLDYVKAMEGVKHLIDQRLYNIFSHLLPEQVDELDWDAITGKPTIPAAQVNSDWNATSGVAAILNKPSISFDTTLWRHIFAVRTAYNAGDVVLVEGVTSGQDKVYIYTESVPDTNTTLPEADSRAHQLNVGAPNTITGVSSSFASGTLRLVFTRRDGNTETENVDITGFAPASHAHDNYLTEVPAWSVTLSKIARRRTDPGNVLGWNQSGWPVAFRFEEFIRDSPSTFLGGWQAVSSDTPGTNLVHRDPGGMIFNHVSLNGNRRTQLEQIQAGDYIIQISTIFFVEQVEKESSFTRFRGKFINSTHAELAIGSQYDFRVSNTLNRTQIAEYASLWTEYHDMGNIKASSPPDDRTVTFKNTNINKMAVLVIPTGSSTFSNFGIFNVSSNPVVLTGTHGLYSGRSTIGNSVIVWGYYG